MKNRYKLKIQIITIFIFLIAWQLAGEFEILDKRIIPSFYDVCIELFKNIVSGEIIKQLSFSILIIVEGIIISFFISMILIFIGKQSLIFSIILETFEMIFNPLPGIAILPFIILWVGVNENSILIVIIHSIIWPLLINFKTGIDSVSKTLVDVSINLNMNSVEKFIHLYFPSSIGNILGGLRIGWGRGWRALISAEMIFGAIGGSGGIGWYIFKKRVFMDTAGMFSGLLVIIIVGIIVENLIFRFFEKMTILKWGMDK